MLVNNPIPPGIYNEVIKWFPVRSDDGAFLDLITNDVVTREEVHGKEKLDCWRVMDREATLL